MVKFSVLAIIGSLSLAGCSGAGLNPDAPGPTRSTGASFNVDQSELETPNGLPSGGTTRNPVATDDGVIGVSHLPP